jgi:hypothetical protein
MEVVTKVIEVINQTMPQIITTMGYQTHGKQLLSKGT